MIQTKKIIETRSMEHSTAMNNNILMQAEKWRFHVSLLLIVVWPVGLRANGVFALVSSGGLQNQQKEEQKDILWRGREAANKSQSQKARFSLANITKMTRFITWEWPTINVFESVVWLTYNRIFCSKIQQLRCKSPIDALENVRQLPFIVIMYRFGEWMRFLAR